MGSYSIIRERQRTTITAAAFAPSVLRRAAPKLGGKVSERRREPAENNPKNLGVLCVLCG
jgi:hypothetical protein